jgi:hypothetical protein
MSFLLNSFYYSFSKNYIEKYKKTKNKKNNNSDKRNISSNYEDPMITIDINFDTIQIIEDYIDYYATNKLVDTILVNTSIKYVSSYKSIISDNYEIECHISNHHFSNDNYENLIDLSFS